MGGTGKTQVLKPIIEFFKRRNEEYRFLVLGPTGSTAALLNSSTYHSVFKIPRESKSRTTSKASGMKVLPWRP
jgi:tetraacyldisaccharide-1-P 4'-kinase